MRAFTPGKCSRSVLLSVACLGMTPGLHVHSQEPKEKPEWLQEHVFCSVAFSPDGKTLASGNWDSTLRFWDTATNQLKASIKGHTVHFLAYSPDGKSLLTCDDKVKVWEPITCKYIRTMKGLGVLACLVFRPDGSAVAASGGERNMTLWDVAGGKALFTLSTPAEPGVEESVSDYKLQCMALSPDGRFLASGYSDKTIALWQVDTGKFIARLKGHSGTVTALSFSADGRTLASGSADRTIKLWEVASRSARGTLKSAVSEMVLGGSIHGSNGKEVVEEYTGEVVSMAFTADGRFLASASTDTDIQLWDLSIRKNIASLRGHHDGARCLVFSPDGKTLASGSSDGTCRLWDVASRTNRAALLWNADHGVKTRGSEGPVQALTHSLDGKMLAYGSGDGLITLQDTNTRKNTTILRGHTKLITSLSFSADGKILASGSLDMTTRLWDAATGRNTATFNGLEMLVQLSPDGKTLASVEFMGVGLKSDVNLRDPATGRVTATFKGTGPPDEVCSLVFSPNSQILAVGNSRHEVSLWNVATGVKRSSLGGFAAAFSPDGKLLATGTVKGRVRLWEVSTGKESATLPIHKGLILAVAFGPDGKTLAAATEDNIIVLWDLVNNRKLTTLDGNKEVVVALSFCPKGKVLAGGSIGGLKLWDTP